MKKLILMFALTIAFVSCTNNSEKVCSSTDSTKVDSTAVTISTIATVATTELDSVVISK